MAERPILFSGPMVRAILDGRKTQTRRIVRFKRGSEPGRTHCYPAPCIEGYAPDSGHLYWSVGGKRDFTRCPYGVPGDTLWVRETFYCDDGDYPDGDRESMLRLMEYRADHDCASWEAGCPCDDGEGRSSWRPSIFMPRWASRLTLRVTSVRVERVQEISADDALAEGVTVPPPTPGSETPAMFPGGRAIHLAAFRELWDSINGKRAPWASNPWAWVVGFEVGDG